MSVVLDDYPVFVKYARTPRWFNGDWADISCWCTEQFGLENWEYSGQGFYFKYQDDAVCFKLRWL